MNGRVRDADEVGTNGMTTAGLTPVAFIDDGLGNSSYLVDLGDGRAA